MAGRRLKPARHLERSRLEELASWLAERVLQLVESELGLESDEVAVRASISEEWPYVVEVEAHLKPRHGGGVVTRELEKVLDKAIAELAEMLAEEGLEPAG